MGFAALRAHHIVAIDRCPVLAPSLDGAIAAAWAVAEALAPQKKPLDIQVDRDRRRHRHGRARLRPAEPGADERAGAPRRTHKLARLTRHGELIAQRAPPTS